MIQRIQSVWLLVVFLIAIGMAHLFKEDTILLFVSALTAALAVVAILRYKDRPRQINFCYAIMVLEVVALVLVNFYIVGHLHLDTIDYAKPFLIWIFILAPVAGLIFALLALQAIKKDEKLVRSMDRLR